jgi:hypothetical protein
MECLSCHKDVFTKGEQVAKACPQCQATAGYKLYHYQQTKKKQDANHKAEVEAARAQPEARQYHTGGMCFANTLLWMQYEKENAGDRGPFGRKYVGKPEEQIKVYQEFLTLMGKQDKYVNALAASFDHYANYEARAGTNLPELDATQGKVSFHLVCHPCQALLKDWQRPAPGEKLGGYCGECGRAGTREAAMSCPKCGTLVAFGRPGYQECPRCPNLYLAIQPIVKCREPEGQANQKVAHAKRREVYTTQAKKRGLNLVHYQIGFMFNADDVGAPVAEMFSAGQSYPTYFGTFGFEGDKGHAHVTCFAIRKDWISFFDPNFGEFLFPSRDVFVRWLSNHLKTDHWTESKVKYPEMHDGWQVALFT